MKKTKIICTMGPNTNDKELMKNMLDTLNLILTDIPIYELSCDMSEEAVMTALEGMQN